MPSIGGGCDPAFQPMEVGVVQCQLLEVGVAQYATI